MPTDMPTIVDAQAKPSYFFQHLEKQRQLSTLPLHHGRKKGTSNASTTQVKGSIVQVFEQLGGEAGLLAFAMDHPLEFYTKILPKVLPLEVGTDPAGQVTIIVQASTPVSMPVPVSSAPPPAPPNRQQLTYDRLHPSARWGESEPVIYTDGQREVADRSDSESNGSAPYMLGSGDEGPGGTPPNLS